MEVKKGSKLYAREKDFRNQRMVERFTVCRTLFYMAQFTQISIVKNVNVFIFEGKVFTLIKNRPKNVSISLALAKNQT
jgi:predicted dinucleotide-utilizing enzyme